MKCVRPRVLVGRVPPRNRNPSEESRQICGYAPCGSWATTGRCIPVRIPHIYIPPHKYRTLISRSLLDQASTMGPNTLFTVRYHNPISSLVQLITSFFCSAEYPLNKTNQKKLNFQLITNFLRFSIPLRVKHKVILAEIIYALATNDSHAL